ncbi:MAG: hypothetical protein AAB518_01045, partial [Patescibacteria group bacterium]
MGKKIQKQSRTTTIAVLLLAGIGALAFLFSMGPMDLLAQVLPRRSPTPRIVYNDISERKLRFATCRTEDCATVRITELGSETTLAPSAFTSLGLTQGRDGLPLIGLIHEQYNPSGFAQTVRTIHCGNQFCSSGNTTAHLTTKGLFSGISLAIGSDDLPVLSYASQYLSPVGIHVVHCGNAKCTSGNTDTLIAPLMLVPNDTSIAIGSDGLPIITFSYQDSTGPGTGNERSNLAVVHCGNLNCSQNNNTKILMSGTLNALATSYTVEPAYHRMVGRIMIG